MKIVSLFSGAGGLDFGFKLAGAKIIWANDIDADSVKTYKHNVGKNVTKGDIKKIEPKDIPDGEVVIGGFPCLGFTIARGKARKVDDEVNFLYLDFLRIVKAKSPDHFLIENVPGMVRGEQFRRLFRKMIKEFEGAGYKIKYKVLNAADFGVPQVRKRIIILGTREDLSVKLFYPQPTHSKIPQVNLDGTRLLPWITIKEAISDLPEPNGRGINIFNHQGTKHKVKINNYMGNRPLQWNKPSPTIMGRGSRTGGPVIHPHPNMHRRLTVRECARLQSFPDDFKFFGSTSSQYAQVGNAVPPLFAFRVAQAFLKAVGENPNPFNPKEWEIPWAEKIPRI